MKALVTGGGGFLGGAIVRLLVQHGYAVRSFTRTAYPWLDEVGVEQVLGDLSEAAAVERAVEGVEIVFHTAAKAGVWGRRADFIATNLTGTENVLAAVRKCAVRRLIYTSTPSVVHNGGDIEGGTETLPYPSHFAAPYPETKARAEQAVLAANGPELATVALRPHLIFGPGDPHLVPRLLTRARAGKLRRIGSRPIKVDVTYIDNAAEAHLAASRALAIGSAAAGQAYFISNDEPLELWPFIDRILAEAGLPALTRTISARKVRIAGRILERVYRLLRISSEPSMTRFVAEQLSTSHWYDISAAKRDLGYEPRVRVAEGLKRLGESLRANPPQ